MSTSSIQDLWEAASASPYEPIVSRDNQFVVGFGLLLIGKFPKMGYGVIKTNELISFRSYITLWPQYASCILNCRL